MVNVENCTCTKCFQTQYYCCRGIRNKTWEGWKDVASPVSHRADFSKRTSDPKREPSWTNPISTKLWFLEKTREIFQSPIPSPSPSNLGSQFKLPSCPALLFQWLLFLDCASLLALFLQSVIKSERGRAPYGLMALAGQGWWWICAARRAPYMQETFCLRPVLRPWWPRQGRTGWDLWKAVLSAHSAPMYPLVTCTVWVSDWTSGWIGSG